MKNQQMKRHTKPPNAKRPTMFGFLCAGCGRCLEELRAWQLGAERFYCGIFCREADERLQGQPVRPIRNRVPGGAGSI
jgi:hypothetical protein